MTPHCFCKDKNCTQGKTYNKNTIFFITTVFFSLHAYVLQTYILLLQKTYPQDTQKNKWYKFKEFPRIGVFYIKHNQAASPKGIHVLQCKGSNHCTEERPP